MNLFKNIILILISMILPFLSTKSLASSLSSHYYMLSFHFYDPPSKQETTYTINQEASQINLVRSWKNNGKNFTEIHPSEFTDIFPLSLTIHHYFNSFDAPKIFQKLINAIEQGAELLQLPSQFSEFGLKNLGTEKELLVDNLRGFHSISLYTFDSILQRFHSEKKLAKIPNIEKYEIAGVQNIQLEFTELRHLKEFFDVLKADLNFVTSEKIDRTNQTRILSLLSKALSSPIILDSSHFPKSQWLEVTNFMETDQNN